MQRFTTGQWLTDTEADQLHTGQAKVITDRPISLADSSTCPRAHET